MLQPFNDSFDRRILHTFIIRRARTVEGSAVDHHTFAGIRSFHRVTVQLSNTFRLNDRNYFQAKLARKRKVAFIVRRYSHDRTRAIRHQHIIRHPDRDAFLIDGVDRVPTGEYTGLFLVLRFTLDVGLLSSLSLVLIDSRFIFRRGDLIHQWMLGGKDHESCAPQRIRAGRKYFDGVTSLSLKDDRGAFTATDPIRLRNLDEVGPVNTFEVQQFISIFGRFEEPLLQFFFDDRCTAAVTDAIITFDLFACQRGIVLRAPIDGCLLTIRQAVFE